MSTFARFLRDEAPLLAGFAGSAIVRSVMSNAYESKRGTEPPTDPSLEDVRWREAVIWTAALAAGGAIGRLVARFAAGELANKQLQQRTLDKPGSD